MSLLRIGHSRVVIINEVILAHRVFSSELPSHFSPLRFLLLWFIEHDVTVAARKEVCKQMGDALPSFLRGAF